MDAKGRKYRALHTGGIEVKFLMKVVLFNKDGAFTVDYGIQGRARDTELKFIDWDVLGNALEDLAESAPKFSGWQFSLPIKSGEGRSTHQSIVSKFDFSNSGDVTSLAEGIKWSETIGVEMAQEAAEKAKIVDPQAVLKGLV